MAQAKIDSTPILEMFSTQEAFVTELAAIENLGPCFRLTFTLTQATVEGDIERVLAAKIIMPADALDQMLMNIPLLIRNLPEKRQPQHPENRTHLN